MLGVVLERAQLLTKARLALLAALHHDARQEAAMSNLVRVAGRLGLASEARDWAQALLRLRPENPLTLYESGRQAMDRGDWETARRHLMRALALGGDWHELHFMLAQAFAQQGLRRDAERHLELARESGPTPALRQRYELKLGRLRQSLSGAEQPSRQ
jgi:uncharacterized protein HemY